MIRSGTMCSVVWVSACLLGCLARAERKSASILPALENQGLEEMVEQRHWCQTKKRFLPVHQALLALSLSEKRICKIHIV